MASLTCYRLKRRFDGERMTSFEDFLNQEERQVRSLDPVAGRNFSARLFVALGQAREPPWVEFLRAGFGEVPSKRSSSMAALLVVRTGSRSSGTFFAFPFGSGGRFLIKPGVWERGYGLRTALNLIFPRTATGLDDAARFVAVDTKRRASDTVRSRRQTSRATAFEAFDVDKLRDVVNAATGPPADVETWGNRISGGDPLHFTIDDLHFGDIGDVCLRVEAAHRRTDYQDRFGWLDHVQPVTDQELLEELEAEVLEILRNEDTDTLELGPPEIVDWERVKSFRYHFEAAKGITHPELRLSDYLRGAKQRTPLDEIDVPSLRRRHIEAVDGDGTTVHRWTVWRCFDGELTLGGATYIMDDGDFFLVANDFVKALDDYIAGIPEAALDLPAASSQTREREYNEGAATANRRLLLLDRKTISTQASTTPVEICDLLSDKRQLIHVKRHLGARDLSHLFSQGFVSAELLQTDLAFRAMVKQRIDELDSKGTFQFFDSAVLRTSDFEIIYAILANWRDRPLATALPFFSKVNLRRTAGDLLNRGFRVSCLRVPAA